MVAGEILIDDTDSGIQYSGSWVQEINTQQNLGNNGVPFQNTLHRTDGTASFSYTFRGSNFLVFGTIETIHLIPTWQCTLDGSSIPPIQAQYTGTTNRIQLCGVNGLAEGSHSITVNVAVPPGGTSFLFDYLQYVPFDDVPLDDAVIEIEFKQPDPRIQFVTTGRWSQVSPGCMASQQGSTFTFNFTGVSVAWLGFYNSTFPMAATTAAYSIDGLDPISFPLDGSIGRTTNGQFRQIFFNTSQLPAGPHVLKVLYQGTAETTPLTISSLIIQNGTNSFTTTTTTAMPSNTGSRSAVTHHSSETGLIVGCAIGGLLLALFLIFGCVWFHRRKMQEWAKLRTPQPYTHPDSSTRESKTSRTRQVDVESTQTTPCARATDSGLQFFPAAQV